MRCTPAALHQGNDMTGNPTIPLSHLIRDTIDVHGLAWAIKHYTKNAKRHNVDIVTLRMLFVAAHCYR
jgi:hypothetical protein